MTGRTKRLLSPGKKFSISILMAIWTAACLALAGCSRPGAAAPRLIADSSVAADLQALADETWIQFLAVFQFRAGCFGDVYLSASHDLDNRAVYEPSTSTVTVRVPATAAMLQGGLIHEWAHHIEYQCEAHKEMRAGFLAAQGLPADITWHTGDAYTKSTERKWASIPSEQYAEAAIVLVLGSRQIPTTVRVSPEAVKVIADWAAGD